MDRLTILVGRPNKSVAPTKYFFKVPQVGRFIPLIGVIRRPVDSPLKGQKELGCDRLTINLRSNNKVNFKKAKKQLYEFYLKSPKVRGWRIWEMLPANDQKVTTQVKFKRLVTAICKT